jgi:uncharacterized membrane protein YheB (UPF0754 family)
MFDMSKTMSYDYSGEPDSFDFRTESEWKLDEKLIEEANKLLPDTDNKKEIKKLLEKDIQKDIKEINEAKKNLESYFNDSGTAKRWEISETLDIKEYKEWIKELESSQNDNVFEAYNKIRKYNNGYDAPVKSPDGPKRPKIIKKGSNKIEINPKRKFFLDEK